MVSPHLLLMTTSVLYNLVEGRIEICHHVLLCPFSQAPLCSSHAGWPWDDKLSSSFTTIYLSAPHTSNNKHVSSDKICPKGSG